MTNVDTTAEETLWTVARVLRWSTQFLREKGSPSAQLDAELLLAFAMGCPRIQLFIHRDQPLSADERGTYRELIRRRSLGEPVAYLIQKKHFWRNEFFVDKNVLIPRPETEMLVEACLSFLKTKGEGAKAVLDVGTGSGCIAISLATEMQDTAVEAWDICRNAIAIAEINALNCGVSDRVLFRQNDALADQVWVGGEQLFDCIVSNPPYIARHDSSLVDASVFNFEPHRALFCDESGLAFYQVLAHQAARRLNQDGIIILEVGLGQSIAVSNLLLQCGWRDIVVKKDLAGIERLVQANRP